MMDWLGKALHLPGHFLFENPEKAPQEKGLKGGGMTVGSASEAIHNAMLAARYNKLDNKKAPLDKLVAYTSSETHSSTPKAAQLALVYIHLLVPNDYKPDGSEDKSGSVTASIFKKALEADRDLGLVPFFMCASIGTTGSCAIDEVEAIGAFCKGAEEEIYFHVDAAYAGSSFISENFAYLRKGLQYADSLDMNPYKFLLASPDLACLWVRHMKKFSKAFDPNAESVKYVARQPKYMINFRSYGIPVTRRMRSLKLWTLFQNYGVHYLKAYVERLVRCAKHFETLVNGDNRYEVMNEVHLALVCFRQKAQ